MSLAVLILVLETEAQGGFELSPLEGVAHTAAPPAFYGSAVQSGKTAATGNAHGRRAPVRIDRDAQQDQSLFAGRAASRRIVHLRPHQVQRDAKSLSCSFTPFR